jgi:hypothetical protein
MLAPSELKPTDEQIYILDLIKKGERKLQIKALAGTGKSSTLKMIDKTLRDNVLYLVFNTRNAKEAIESGEFRDSTKIKTINGCGHGVWANHVGKVIIDEKKSPKTRQLFYSHLQTLERSAQNEAWEEWYNVRQAVSLAKALGYVPPGKFPDTPGLCDWVSVSNACDEPLTPLARELTDAVLALSIKTAFKGFIDFDDQVYMSALWARTFPRFPMVMGDETQDFSPINHAFLSKLVDGGFLSVGDDNQSIYGFRGAMPGSMAKLKDHFRMSESDLSISFRCSQAIVESVRWRVPHFKWIKPGGIVSEIDRPSLSGILNNSAIICRNNAPLFRLAIRLLSAGRAVRVHGSDMGPRVAGIMKKLGPENMSRDSVMSAIEDWEGEHLEKGSKTASDIAECMRVFASHGATLAHALVYVREIFKQDGSIELLTGHKAKGMEWDRVYFLDPWLIGEGEQELNLRYVIMTRAKQELYMLNSKEIQ